jgi:hypothetical protein
MLALVVGGVTATVAAAAAAPPALVPSTVAVQHGFELRVFAAPSSTAISKPDDLAVLGNAVFIGYQNGVGAMGEPASGTGQTQSTIVEYGPHGHTLASWNVTGKVDGLGSNTSTKEIIATVNEDGNSSLYTISPSTSDVDHFTLSPDPTSLGGGGTDAVSVLNGTIYLSGSNPSAANAPALYSAALNEGSGVASLTSVFDDNATATGPGGPVALALTDPDTNAVVPPSVPTYGGDLVLVGQADSQFVFVKDPGTVGQTLTQLPVGTQVDGVAIATAHAGTLLLNDNTTGSTYALRSHTFTPGTIFVSTANDAGVPGIVGSLNLTTGQISPIAIGFTNPHDLHFIPGH